MDCPQCRRLLREATYEGVLIRICDKCGGEFIGADELAHIVRTREERFPESSDPIWADMKPQFGVPESETRRVLDCPQCGTRMGVNNYGGDSGIYIDRCPQCGGVWLDSDELENVQILMERWADEAPAQIRTIAGQLEQARRNAASTTSNAFAGSRFAFINAIINRFLDAA